MKTSKPQNLITLTFALALALALASCEKQIPFPDDETTPLVVFNAVAEPDSTLTATLSFSRFFLSNHSFRPVNNAQLTLRVGSQTFAATRTGDGLYSFGSFRPQPGDSLVLDGSVTNYAVLGDEPARIHAATRVPLRPQASVSDVSSSNGGYTVNARLTFSDPAGEHNCYGLLAHYTDTVQRISYTVSYDYDSYYGDYIYSDTVIDTVVRSRYIAYELNDILLVDDQQSQLGAILDGDMEEVGQGHYYGYNLIFSDDRIDGKQHTVALSLRPSGYYYGDYYEKRSPKGKGPKSWTDYQEFPFGTPRLALELVALSPEYYRYILSCDKQYNTEDLGGLFSEPVVIQCNVEGGIGCLGAQSTTRIEVPVQLNR